MRDLVYISYAAADQGWLPRVRRHLLPRVELGRLRLWARADVTAGERLEDQAASMLGRARVGVLLVSQDYLVDDEIADERAALLAAAAAGELRLIWVPVRPSGFQETGLAPYQPAHPAGEPLAGLPEVAVEASLVALADAVQAAYDAAAPRAAGAAAVHGALTGVLAVPDAMGASSLPPEGPEGEGGGGRWLRRLAVLGAIVVLGAGVVGWSLGLFSDPEVTCAEGAHGSADPGCEAGRPLRAAGTFIVLDGRAEPVGLARVTGGWLRPRVAVDVPDPARRAPRYRLRAVEAGATPPPQLVRAGEVRAEGPAMRLNLGRRHGLREGAVYAGAAGGYAIVAQVGDGSAIMRRCLGTFGDGRVEQRDRAAVVAEPMARAEAALGRGDVEEAGRRQEEVACLDGEAGRSLGELVARARREAAAALAARLASQSAGGVHISAQTNNCQDCNVQVGQTNVMTGVGKATGRGGR